MKDIKLLKEFRKALNPSEDVPSVIQSFKPAKG